jgi:hypothetical protein
MYNATEPNRKWRSDLCATQAPPALPPPPPIEEDPEIGPDPDLSKRLKKVSDLLQSEKEKLVDLKTQIKQLTASQLYQTTDAVKTNNTVEEINKQITYYTGENLRLRIKNNGIIDALESYKTLVSGSNKPDGYEITAIKQQINNDNLRKGEFSMSKSDFVKEGYSSGPIIEPMAAGMSLGSILSSAVSNATSTATQTNPSSTPPSQNRENNLKEITRISTEIQNIQPEIAISQRELDELKKKDDESQKKTNETLGLKDKKTAHISYLMEENKRLKNKNNFLLDSLQYFRSTSLGNDKVAGYKDTTVKQQIESTVLKTQEIGNPIAINANTKEGFITGTAATYNAVFTQNQALENQITNTKDRSTINDQITKTYIKKLEWLKLVNRVLLIFFLFAILFACYKISSIPNITMSIYKKVGIIMTLILSIFIIHSIEYVLFDYIPFFSALLLGTPYSEKKYWEKPSWRDYSPW